ncbi:MAG: hypothetical protein KGN34_11350 [Sphingomonadales bacterium]|nr:hypothetical protein [Sphingomonadales bacterium]
MRTWMGLAVLGAVVMPVAAWADDPNDPAMRDPRARARDHELTRQLNVGELAYVQRRDAGYAEGWRNWRQAQGGYSAPAPQADANGAYARERARYERELADWRRAVAACRAGDYDACQ